MSSPAFETAVFDRLLSSDLFAEFQDAFRNVTGLPLGLMRQGENWCAGVGENRSPFCDALDRCEVACQACLDTNLRLSETAGEVDGPMSCRCFAGLSATLVPVKLGQTTIGFLRTGQVFNRTPDEEDFAELIAHIDKKGEFNKETSTVLRNAYFQTKEVDPARYESMVSLLNLFADQLSAHAEKVALMTKIEEPKGIAAARLMIHRELDEPIPLPKLAAAANMSVSHFCRVFKEVTALTVTEYITRVRINKAKEELLRPDRQVSEIAYEIGFQSLSQFYRAFSREVGMSPSEFRKQQQEPKS